MSKATNILNASLQPDFELSASPILTAILRKKILSVTKNFNFDCKCTGQCNINMVADVMRDLELWGVCSLDKYGWTYSGISQATTNNKTLYRINNPLPVLNPEIWQDLWDKYKRIWNRICLLLDTPGFKGIVSLDGASNFMDKRRLAETLKEGRTAILNQGFKVFESKTFTYEAYLDALKVIENSMAQTLGVPGGLLGRSFTHSNYEAALQDLENSGLIMAQYLDKWFGRISMICKPQLIKDLMPNERVITSEDIAQEQKEPTNKKQKSTISETINQSIS